MKRHILVLAVAFSIVIFGCTQTSNDVMEQKGTVADNGNMVEYDAMEQKDTAVDDVTIDKEEVMTNKENEMINKEDSMMEGEKTEEGVMPEKTSYSGKVLAGADTKYLEFSKADYELALKENKKIVLYFYANWCPICKAEQNHVFSAFSEIKDKDLIGFRINYRDTQTDADEEALAKQYGITYQHTKVLLKDGKEVSRSLDRWDKEKYLSELSKI